jgi:hypothetical protein
MQSMYYIGLDVHKKTISYCVKDGSGRIHAEGAIPATRSDLDRWMRTLPQPWTAAMEAAGCALCITSDAGLQLRRAYGNTLHCRGRVSGRTFNHNSSINHPFPFPSLALPWRGAIFRRLILASFVK